MTAHCVIKTPTRSSHTHLFVNIDPLSNEKLGILVKKLSKSVKPFSSYDIFVIWEVSRSFENKPQISFFLA